MQIRTSSLSARRQPIVVRPVASPANLLALGNIACLAYFSSFLYQTGVSVERIAVCLTLVFCAWLALKKLLFGHTGYIVRATISRVHNSLRHNKLNQDRDGTAQDLNSLIQLHLMAGNLRTAGAYSKELILLAEDSTPDSLTMAHRDSIETPEAPLRLFRAAQKFPVSALAILCGLLACFVAANNVFRCYFSSIGAVIFLVPMMFCLHELLVYGARHKTPVLDLGPEALRINNLPLKWSDVSAVRANGDMLGIDLNRRLTESEIVSWVFLILDTPMVLQIIACRFTGQPMSSINIPTGSLPLTANEIVEQIEMRRELMLSTADTTILTIPPFD